MEIIVRGNFPKCQYAREAESILEDRIRRALAEIPDLEIRFESKRFGKTEPMPHKHCILSDDKKRLGRYKIPVFCDHGEINRWVECDVWTRKCHVCGEVIYRKYNLGCVFPRYEDMAIKEILMMKKVKVK